MIRAVYLCHQLLDLVEQLGSLPAGGRLPVLAGLPPLGRGLQLRHLTGYLYLQHTIHDQHPGCTDSHGEPVFFDLPPIVTVGRLRQSRTHAAVHTHT